VGKVIYMLLDVIQTEGRPVFVLYGGRMLAKMLKHLLKCRESHGTIHNGAFENCMLGRSNMVPQFVKTIKLLIASHTKTSLLFRLIVFSFMSLEFVFPFESSSIWASGICAAQIFLVLRCVKMS
jgi:hypothetical protein